MPRTTLNPLNEHELAQLLSGSLDNDSRMALLTRLAADPAARTVLRMAIEALEVADSADQTRSRPAA
jgi:hypothetical protein